MILESAISAAIARYFAGYLRGESPRYWPEPVPVGLATAIQRSAPAARVADAWREPETAGEVLHVAMRWVGQRRRVR